jgi:hypothetical protein
MKTNIYSDDSKKNSTKKRATIKLTPITSIIFQIFLKNDYSLLNISVEKYTFLFVAILTSTSQIITNVRKHSRIKTEVSV